MAGYAVGEGGVVRRFVGATREGTSIVQGRVNDVATSNAVSAATVELLSNDVLAAVANTSPSGHFVFPELSPGNYRVRVTSTGYVAQVSTSTALFPDQSTSVDMKLTPTSSGTVTLQALSLDGINDFVEVPASPSLNVTNAFTLEAWVKIKGKGGVNPRLLSKRDASASDYSWGFFGNSKRMHAELYFTDQTAFLGDISSAQLLDSTKWNQWYHLAMVWNSATGTITTYVNGVQDTIIRSASGIGLNKTLTARSQRLTIGNTFYGGTFSVDNFNGNLDEIRVWNEARTFEQIFNTMNVELFGTEPGLVALWHLNEVAEGVVKDATPNHNNGTLKNGSTVTDVNEQPKSVVTEYALFQNYPNPFNPTTMITFVVPTSVGTGTTKILITLKVFDMLGREVATLVNEEKEPGQYQVTFDGSRLASGVYFYKLSAGKFMEVKRMILAK
jgi:hypothetical protein